MSSQPVASLAAIPDHFKAGSAIARPIVVPANGTATVSYRFGLAETVELQSISVDVDTTGAGGAVVIEVALRDQSGAQLAAIKTGAGLDAGLQGQATFAANLPDSSTFPAPALVQEIQAALWESALPEQATIRVTAQDAGAAITEARIFVYSLGEMTGEVRMPPLLRAGIV